jgi:hypothetical protein
MKGRIMKVVSINGSTVNHKDEQKESMLEVLAEMKRQIEAGEIKEFVACSLDEDGVSQIHVSAMDFPGSIGLFEIGKHMLIAQETYVIE